MLQRRKWFASGKWRNFYFFRSRTVRNLSISTSTMACSMALTVCERQLHSPSPSHSVLFGPFASHSFWLCRFICTRERLGPEQWSLVGLTLWPACLLISEVRFCKLMAVGIAVLQPYCYGARHSQGTRLHLRLCAVLRKCNLDFFARIRK